MFTEFMGLLLQASRLAFNVWAGVKAREAGRSAALNFAVAAFVLPMAVFTAVAAAG